MKKNALILTLLCLGLCARAQEFVSCDDPRYWFHSCCNMSCDTGSELGFIGFPGEVADFYRNYGTTTLYGLAAPVNVQCDNAFVSRYGHEAHEGSIVVYQGEPHSQLQLVERLRFNDEDYHLLMNHSKRIVRTALGTLDHQSYTDTLWLMEFYFPRPVVVSGNFFAGTRSHEVGTHNITSLHAYATSFTCPECEFEVMDTNWIMSRQWYEGAQDTGIYFFAQPFLPVFVPILLPPEPDSGACQRPEESPELIDCTPERGYATVRWSHRAPDGGKQQIAIAPWPSSPDSATRFDRGASMPAVHTFSDLDPTATYAVWLRDECCHHINLYRDTTWWTDWSEPLLFSLAPEPDTTTGISLPDAPGEVLSVEYFDLLGRPLAQPPTRGLYIRRETTTSGVSTRKIVRQ